MTSIQPQWTKNPEMIAHDEATKMQREQILEALKKAAAEQNGVKLEKTPEQDVVQKKSETVDSSAPKKGNKLARFAKATLSFFAPGLGQICDGRGKDGLKDFGTAVGLTVAGTAVGRLGAFDFIKTVQKAAEVAGKTGAKTIAKTPYGFYASLALCSLVAVGLMANKIHSAVDAYKNSK